MSNSAFTVSGTGGGSGSGTVTSVNGTANRITSTGGNNPVIDIDSAYVGQTSITTLGTIATGVWSGTVILPAKGGSGVASPTAHGLLIGEGASPFASLVLTNNQLLAGVTGSDPVGTLTPTGLTSIGVGNFAIAANTISTTGAMTFATSGNNDINLTPGGSGSTLLKNDPTQPLGAATKQYADAIASGLFPQPACAVATTANLSATYANGAAGVGATLTNNSTQVAISIDGVSLSLNDRVLVKNQTAQEENGIYTVTTVGSGATDWVLTRAANYDTPAEIQQGDLVIIQQGTVNAITSWVQTAVVTTIGTDPIIFSQFTYGVTITSVSGTANRITVSAGNNPVVDISAAYVGQASITTLGTIATGTWNGTTIAVANGGTGNTTFTPYGVLCAGTTATGAFANVAGVGTTGQVLTSNGPGAYPTWQASGGGGSGKVVQIVSSGIIAGSSTGSSTYVDVTGAVATITPTSASNNIYIMATWQQIAGLGGGNTLAYNQVLRDATNISGVDQIVTASILSAFGAAAYCGQAFSLVDSPATTSAVTYKIQQRILGAASATCSNIVITLMEITP